MNGIRLQEPAAPVRPSIRDVARLAGVSAGCVSNVLNRRRSQTDPIGRAVMEAAGTLDYRANPIASNLRRAKSSFVGVVVPDFENPFFGALLSALERCADGSGYRLASASSRENARIEAREIDELLGWRVAGILLAPTFRGTCVPDRIMPAGVPSVLLDRVSGHSGTDEVGVNNKTAARDLTRRLIELGHRQLLVAYSGDEVHNIAERLRGVREAASAAPHQIDVTELSCGPDVETAAKAFEAHFLRHQPPSAIFALHNLAALAALGAVQQRGLAPGRDLALASFDDSPWMAHMHPAVTAVVQPVENIAQAAWDRLITRIEGARGPAELISVACALEERETMIPPAAAGAKNQ